MAESLSGLPVCKEVKTWDVRGFLKCPMCSLDLIVNQDETGMVMPSAVEIIYEFTLHRALGVERSYLGFDDLKGPFQPK